MKKIKKIYWLLLFIVASFVLVLGLKIGWETGAEQTYQRLSLEYAEKQLNMPFTDVILFDDIYILSCVRPKNQSIQVIKVTLMIGAFYVVEQDAYRAAKDKNETSLKWHSKKELERILQSSVNSFLGFGQYHWSDYRFMNPPSSYLREQVNNCIKRALKDGYNQVIDENNLNAINAIFRSGMNSKLVQDGIPPNIKLFPHVDIKEIVPLRN